MANTIYENMYDKIIIGAGLYGLYAAEFCGRQYPEQKILVLEKDREPFSRATYINQARVHMGYHYPRSISTAMKSAHYFNRFMEDFSFCVLEDFEQIYATSADFSWTNAKQFEKFCRDAQIPCDVINANLYFKDRQCDGAFLTKEYTYDAMILKDYFLKKISALQNVEIRCNVNITAIQQAGSLYEIALMDYEKLETPFLLNATYASTNQIIKMLGFEPFKIKYELCEIILCNVNERLKGKGITVMDGPFFSIMPFGKTGYHSLTSVTFTPHVTSYGEVPSFDCQRLSNGYCDTASLGNCDGCIAKPKSAWPYMSSLAHKYLKDELQFEYSHSLFSMKPILKASEIDDSRPTVVKCFSQNPTFISVLSGKINTVYDLDEVLV